MTDAGEPCQGELYSRFDSETQGDSVLCASAEYVVYLVTYPTARSLGDSLAKSRANDRGPTVYALIGNYWTVSCSTELRCAYYQEILGGHTIEI